MSENENEKALQVSPALVMAIIREGIDTGTLKSFSVSFKNNALGSMVDFEAKYFRPYPEMEYRMEGAEDSPSVFLRSEEHSQGEARARASREPQSASDKPVGWERGAIIERGVATSAGSALVRYELLDDGRRVGDEWFFLSKAMAIVNGQAQEPTRTDVTPVPGDTAKESFRIAAPGNGGVYIALPIDPFGPGARFELISPESPYMAGIITPATSRVPESMSGWKEFFDVYQSGISFLSETDSFHTDGSDFFPNSEEEEFIDDIPI